MSPKTHKDSKTSKPLRRTRLLTGQAKSRYVRTLLEQNGASPEQAGRADEEIMHVQVRSAAAQRLTTPLAARRRRFALPDISPSAPPPLAASPSAAAVEAVRATSPAAPATEPFNPYAFSAMAILLNEGRAALEARLEAATTREQVIQLAEAQSVRLDPAALGAKKASMKALRRAFVDAVERRIAHRRAVSG